MSSRDISNLRGQLAEQEGGRPGGRDGKPRVDTEITSLISIYDSNVKLSNYLNEHPKVKNPCFLAVGWDRKLHIWDDPALKNDNGPEEEDDAVCCIDLPPPTTPNLHK